MAEEEVGPPSQEKMSKEQRREEQKAPWSRWKAEDVADKMEEKFPEWKHLFIEHDITGDRLLWLTVNDMKDMGITTMGDRLELKKVILGLQSKERIRQRTMIIASAVEAFPGSECEKSCTTCYGLCPRDPDRYILTAKVLKIKHFEVTRLCGCIPLTCCGASWVTDNVDLDEIKDIDSHTTTQGCAACKEEKIIIEFSVKSGVENDLLADDAEGAREGDGGEGGDAGDHGEGHEGANRIDKKAFFVDKFPADETMSPGEEFAETMKNAIAEAKENHQD